MLKSSFSKRRLNNCHPLELDMQQSEQDFIKQKSRKVSFGLDSIVLSTPYFDTSLVNTSSQETVSQLWYTQDEFIIIKKEIREQVIAMRNINLPLKAVIENQCVGDCTRGLERLLSRDRGLKQKMFIRIIVHLQKQTNNFFPAMTEQNLSKASILLSTKAKKYAFKMAKNDYDVVYGSSMRRNLPKIILSSSSKAKREREYSIQFSRNQTKKPRNLNKIEPKNLWI